MAPAAESFDAILIGTGSGLELVNGILQINPEARVAVIDKDEPGGICLNRGCIPSKIMVTCADLIRNIQRAGTFGITAETHGIDFPRIMGRMRAMVRADADPIKKGLESVPNVRYFPAVAAFVGPSATLAVAGMTITAPKIFLCTGSRPVIPPIDGLEKTGYLTSDTLLKQTRLPRSLAIIGGGYIAAEYGHFFSAMGSEVTIIGRNPQFLHEEEPKISFLAERALGRGARILSGFEVIRVERGASGEKTILAKNRAAGTSAEIQVEEILIAAGRGPDHDLLHPEKSGIAVDENGRIRTNERMETSQPGIWAFGDGDGRYLFKHVANHEAEVAFSNAVLNKDKTADYHAVPHAVFMYPEIAAVGLGEAEAVRKFGEKNILIGFGGYEQTAKGSALEAKDCFAKIIIHEATGRLLGAHIIGPDASVLIQEIVTILYTKDPSLGQLIRAMHIHPALSELLPAACRTVMHIDEYHELLKERGYLPQTPNTKTGGTDPVAIGLLP